MAAPFVTVKATRTITQNVEYSIANDANYSAGSPVAVDAKVQAVIDLDTMIAGDVVEIRFYKGVNGGTQGVMIGPATLSGAQSQRWTMPEQFVAAGWDISIKLTSATSRSIKFEVIKDIGDVNVATIAADAVNANALAADAATEIRTGLATSAALATVQADTDDIQARLPAALVGGRMSSDVGSWLGTAAAAPTVAGIPRVEDATTQARLTATRAGFLDNLNVGGNVASSAEATAIQNNTRVVRVVPTAIERPDAGTQTYRVEVLLYDSVGNMEVPDSAPTLTLVNQAGTDLSARLDSTTMALVSTGRYRVVYTAALADALEQLIWTFSVVEGGATRLYGNTSLIVDTTAVDFTSADRTKLSTLATDLTTARAANLDNLDVAVTTRASATALTSAAGDIIALGVAVAGVQSDTYNIQTRLPAALDGAGNIKAGVQTVIAGGLTAIADAAAAAVFAFLEDADAPVGAQTFLERLRIKWSIFCGKAIGLTINTVSAEAFRDAADTKDRATFALAVDGTRTPGTLDGT